MVVVLTLPQVQETQQITTRATNGVELQTPDGMSLLAQHEVSMVHQRDPSARLGIDTGWLLIPVGGLCTRWDIFCILATFAPASYYTSFFIFHYYCHFFLILTITRNLLLGYRTA